MTSESKTTPTRYRVNIPYVTRHIRQFNVFAENKEDAVRYARELFRMDQKENCEPFGDAVVETLNPGTVCHEA